MGRTRTVWLVAVLAVAASQVTALLVGGLSGAGVMSLVGSGLGAVGVDVGHAGPYLAAALSGPVILALSALPAMVVVRLFGGAHPVLGPVAAVCAGLPVAVFVSIPVAAVVEVVVLALIVRPQALVSGPVPEPTP
jgi:hypothetical protein